MARRLREVVGPEIPIVMTLDLHANISPLMISQTNATVCYASNPHLDQKARGLEAAEIMAKTLSGEITPVQAMEKPPLRSSICIRNSTQRAPRLRASMRTPRPSGDGRGWFLPVRRWAFTMPTWRKWALRFVAVANGDSDLARRAARWMSERAWARRHEFACDLVSTENAVRQAAEAAQGPVVLMDVGDNVGGGSPADSTVLFAEVLRQRVPNALVILFTTRKQWPLALPPVCAKRNRTKRGRQDRCAARNTDQGEGEGAVNFRWYFCRDRGTRHGGWGSLRSGCDRGPGNGSAPHHHLDQHTHASVQFAAGLEPGNQTGGEKNNHR